MKHRLFIAYIAILLAFCLPLHTRRVEEAGQVLAAPQKSVTAFGDLSLEHVAEVSEVTPAPVIVAVSPGSHDDLLAAAGIPSDQWDAANTLIMRESGWHLDSRNSIGCIGLLQNCPDGTGYYWLVDACPNWQQDPVCQLARFYVYAQERYGNFQAGLAHSYALNWW